MGIRSGEINNFLLVADSFIYVNHKGEVPCKGEFEWTHEYMHVVNKENDFKGG